MLSSKILGLNGWNVWVTVQQANKQSYATEMSIVTHFAEPFMMIMGLRLSGSQLVKLGQLWLAVKYL